MNSLSTIELSIKEAATNREFFNIVTTGEFASGAPLLAPVVKQKFPRS